MPIVGITTNRVAHMGRLGVLRKGGVKPNDRQPGPDLQHFRFDGKGDQALEDAFAQVYGTEPNYIRVFLPYATADENFQAWREEYGKSGMKHRCDGETVWEVDHNQKWVKTDKPCPGGCQKTSRLTVIIPELIMSSKRVGETTIITSSEYDMRRLTDNLLYYESISGGDLRGIPFVVFRREEIVSLSYSGRNGEPIKTRGPKWLINLEPAPEYVERRLEVIRRNALTAGLESLPALTDSQHENDDDAIEAEYQHVNSNAGEIIEENESPFFEAEQEGLIIDHLYDASDTAAIQKHIQVWRRFRDVVVPIALEVGATASVDMEKYESLALDDLVKTAQKATAMAKNKMRMTLGDESPDDNAKLEEWLEEWKSVFTSQPVF